MRAIVVAMLAALLAAALGVYLASDARVVQASAWPMREGEICLQVVDEGDPIVKLVAMDMGSNHYMLSGRIILPGEPTFIEPIFGNAEVKGGKVYVNRGTREGVSVGQTFTVGEVEVLRDPDTGEVLDESMTEIARLSVSQVKEKISIADVTSGKVSSISKGMAIHQP